MCQVCHHEPLDKKLCEPNKTLRMTVKAVLKKKLMEKNTLKKKEEEAAKAKAEAAQSAELAAQAEVSLVNGDNTNDTEASRDGNAENRPSVNGVSLPVADDDTADPSLATDTQEPVLNQKTVCNVKSSS